MEYQLTWINCNPKLASTTNILVFRCLNIGEYCLTIYYFVDDTRTIIQNNVTPSARNRPGTLRLEKHKDHVTIRNPAMESMINQQNLLTSACNKPPHERYVIRLWNNEKTSCQWSECKTQACCFLILNIGLSVSQYSKLHSISSLCLPNGLKILKMVPCFIVFS